MPSVIQYLDTAFILGRIRWRSGGTTASIVTHAVNNATLRAMVIVASAFVP
jgi:membrane protease YdiL (CAAX protease family)